MAGGLLEMGGEHLEPGVGVDAPGTHSADDVLAVEGVAGGVGEQVTHRGALGAGRVLEIDEAPVHGDQGAERREGLGEAGELPDPLGVALGVHRALRVGHPERVLEVGIDRDRGVGRDLGLGLGLHAVKYGISPIGARSDPGIRLSGSSGTSRRPAEIQPTHQSPHNLHILPLVYSIAPKA